MCDTTGGVLPRPHHGSSRVRSPRRHPRLQSAKAARRRTSCRC